MKLSLGIAVYNRLDLLRRCLASVDVPLQSVLLVNNGPVALDLPRLLDGAAWPVVAEWIVAERPQNVGVAGAWNLIQDRAFVYGQDALMICGNDIEWLPGDLARVLETVAQNPAADFVFGNHAYSNFLVRPSGWHKIGAFDENIELAYLEDADHWQRIRRTPGVNAIHAAGLNARHEGSATIKSDAAYAARSSHQHQLNWQYYARKWGCPVNSHAQERFATPFDGGGPINAWTLDEGRKQRPFVFDHNPVEGVV